MLPPHLWGAVRGVGIGGYGGGVLVGGGGGNVPRGTLALFQAGSGLFLELNLRYLQGSTMNAMSFWGASIIGIFALIRCNVMWQIWT